MNTMKFVTYVDIELAQTFNNVHPWTMVIYNIYFFRSKKYLKLHTKIPFIVPNT